MPLLEKVAVFGERRQEVLASNLANVNTPGYKTRDLPVEDFQNALKQAVAQKQQPQSLGGAMPWSAELPMKDLQSLFDKKLFEATEAASSNITFQDAGNRSVEHEVMEMTKNTMMQSLAVELMSAQMSLLQAVISERV